MAEPARQLNDDDDQHLSATERAKRQWGMAPAGSDVEDPEDEKKSARERANDRWGMNGDEDLADKETSSGEGGGFYKPSGGEEQAALEKTGARKDSGADAPAGPRWVKGDGTRKNIQRFVSNVPFGKKGVALGGGATAGVAILFFIFFSFFSTYKTASILNDIESQVGKVPEYAIERRLEYYMNRYLISRQLVKMGVPEKEITERYVYLGKGPFETLYTNWRGADLEGRLERDYGVRLKADVPVRAGAFNKSYTLPQNWSLELTGAGRADPNLGAKQLNSIEVRDFIREFAKSETRSTEIIKRHNIRKVLKKYYGIGGWRQFVYDRNDKYKNASDRYQEGKKNFKKKVVSSTIGKMNASWGSYMECLLDGGTKSVCTATRKATSSGEQLIDDGELDKLAKEAADEVGEEVAEEAAEAVADKADSLIAKKLTEKLSKFSVRKFATYSIPGIGWAEAASDITNSVDSGVLSQVVYAKNAAQYAGFAAPFLSGSDQLRSGIDVDSDDARVLNGTFKDYEKSPLYSYNQLKRAGKSASSEKIKKDCNGNGTTDDPDDFVRANDPICTGKKVLQDKESFTKSEAWKVWSSVGSLTDNAIVEAIRGAFDKAMELSGISKAIGVLLEKSGADQALNAGFEYILVRIAAPVITGQEVSGDAYDATYAGMSVIKASFGGAVGENREDTIGGAALTSNQVAQIKAEQYHERQNELKREGTFARYFSPDIPESLTSQAIAVAPTSTTSAASMFSNLLKPSSFIGSTLSNFTADAEAQASDGTNPFGVIEFGYPADSEVFEMDHEDLEKAYQCDKPASDRPQNDLSTYSDYGGEMPFKVPSQIDPCQLEVAVQDAGTRYFDKTYDEGIDDGSAGTNAGGGGQTGLLNPGGLSWPNNAEGSSITACYGEPRGGGPHRGMDIGIAPDTPAFASADGVVAFAGAAQGYGDHYVAIKHTGPDGDFFTGYGHMNSHIVEEGDQVNQGQQIGTIGSQGNSSGPHMHFNLTIGAGDMFNGNADPLDNGMLVPPGALNPQGCPKY